VIEFAAEFRVLVGRPFVEHQERPLFELGDDERKPPALSAR
jgi:hypothetical protein